MKPLLIFAFLSAMFLGAKAQNQFEAIELQVADNNAALASMRQSNKAMNLNDDSENKPDGPEVEFEHLWGRGGVTKWSAGVSQSFDWPWTYSSRSKASKARSDARAMMLAMERADVIFKARQLMIEIVGIRLQMEFADSMLSNLERLMNRTRLAVERGQATRLDLSKTRFAILSLRRDRDALSLQLNSSRNELTALNGGKSIDISSLCSYPSASLLDEKSYIEAFDNNPAYAPAMNAQTEAARASAAAEARSSWPGFSIGYRHAFEEQTHFNGLTVGIKLPSFATGNKRKAAEAEIVARSLDMDNYTFSSHARIMADVANARRLAAGLLDYEDAFDSVDYAGILERLYENAQISVIDYITEINYYLDIRRQYLQMQNEYQLTLAALNRYL